MAVSGTANARAFDNILQGIRDKTDEKTKQGREFEVLTKRFLETEPGYKNQFNKTWLWGSWPKRTTGDIGVDIMCERYDGTYCAVQCKFYDDSNTIQNHDVASFISAISAIAKESNITISQKIFVHTSNAESSTSIKKLNSIHCTIIDKSKMITSNVDWSKYPDSFGRLKDTLVLRPYQEDALESVMKGFETNDRGKLIMACGTGKTLTSLHIAQEMYGKGGLILYVVPSISLIQQAMLDWSSNNTLPVNFISVCSDKTVARDEDGSLTDLDCPVSTDPDTLKGHIKLLSKDTMNVMFSTYHSLPVVSQAMKGKQFDIILCDEAHRTTGIEEIEDDSYFKLAHKDKDISTKKRLYMTATPRVYSDTVKNKSNVYSMDDEKTYGPEFYNLSFREAVNKGILSNFRVKIGVISADDVDAMFQQSITDKDDNTMSLNEATNLVSVWHALKYTDETEKEINILKRVIAFTNRIRKSEEFAGVRPNKHGVDCSFSNIVSQYEAIKGDNGKVQVQHMDGSTSASKRREQLEYLKEPSKDPNTCKILSNARCLSEGVDVPALDGIIFLEPRNSRVDVVQAVGRVMRKAEGKKEGYIILPVAIPSGIDPVESLDDSKIWKTVWQVMRALKSHDESFADEINTLILSGPTGPTGSNDDLTERVNIIISNKIDRITLDAFYAKAKSKLIKIIGESDHYDKFGEEAGYQSRIILSIIKNRMESNNTMKTELEKFHEGLKKLINNSVTFESTLQAVSQHVVLAPIFDELFSGNFTTHNPISKAFNDIIDKVGLKEELRELDVFYEEAKQEISRIKTDEERQNFIIKIYDNFFKGADKKGTEQHGIVYTPLEIIKFILASVQYILKTEFGKEFASNNVKILDPFTGTGSFIAQLINSNYLNSNLTYKYKYDLHANELILLAYYIATVNIETTFTNKQIHHKQIPFKGINYTDTLNINPQYREDPKHRMAYEKFSGPLEKAHERIHKQKWSHLHVIVGNPPYSGGQNNFNDQNQNIKYPELDKRIDETYKTRSKTTAINSLYDSYIRSIRWACDRIGTSGIVGFVTNASFIKSPTATGVRAALYEEFTDIWCFYLRGDGRHTGDGRNVFEYPGQNTGGSRTPIVITILVKNPKKEECTIHYTEIESEYYSGQDKRNRIEKLGSIQNIKNWQIITPDKHHDWIRKRNDEFEKYTAMGTKEAKAGNKSNTMFKLYSMGITTSRDAWAYNYSKDEIIKNMKRTITYCNKQDLDKPIMDNKYAKWSPGLTDRLRKHKPKFDEDNIRVSLYRPFFKQYLYYDKTYNHRRAQIPQIFPKEKSNNIIIIISKSDEEPSTLIVNMTPESSVISTGQCFPLYQYVNDKPIDNITDYILKQYQEYYNDNNITKEDIFYYTYGLLHHEGYKKKFATNLSKELPRIPMAPNFKKFVTSGRKLAELHINYETGPKYDIQPIAKFGHLKDYEKDTKLAYPKIKQNNKLVPDKTRLKINGIIAFENLPDVQYKVNGRTPLEWMIDRYKRIVDTDSDIVNDPIQDMTEEKTISIIQRLIYIAVESDKIINEVSKLEFEPKDWNPEPTNKKLDQYNDSSY